MYNLLSTTCLLARGDVAATKVMSYSSEFAAGSYWTSCIHVECATAPSGLRYAVQGKVTAGKYYYNIVTGTLATRTAFIYNVAVPCDVIRLGFANATTGAVVNKAYAVVALYD